MSRTVADAYFPHELTPIGARNEPRLTLQTLDLGPVLLGYVGWGANIEIVCDYPGAYEVNLPLTGHLVSRGRRGPVTSVAGQAAVFRADTLSVISHWDATCTVLGVKFDRDWLDLEAERILGSEPARVAGVMPDRLDLDAGPGEDWRQLVNSLAPLMRRPDAFSGSPAVREQLAGAVAAGFLLTSCPDLGHGPIARPRTISRVVDAVRDDPARTWTVADMAAIGNTTVRRLQEGFQEWIGCPPTEHLTVVRLQRAKADLEDRTELSVSDVAARWGFSSPSRFAAAYRRRYGHPPSAARRGTRR
ncbi:transcriptional activator FtrA [Pseudonocardia autotrophica]|uniref:Transcriptional activator FtrA n=1 Tax=Pseudonocardia autotrophica TaxID=2074 RepID=A0A1Y2MUP4_PSEAH|nr:transcriptional activator FtrA [Pseudonocardia autotrophica]